MEPEFWLQRWRSNEIAFHQAEINPLLAARFEDLSLERGSRVFVPLCGKSLDIPWLLSRGYRVTGVELSELAIEQLFAGLRVEPRLSKSGKLARYSERGLDIFVGDIFDLTAKALCPVDAVYDRAALVALPREMRAQYATHVIEITRQAPQLLITFEYDQNLMAGPPFSLSRGEVRRLYNDHYEVTLAESRDVAGGLKGICPATENAWLLRRKPESRAD